MTRPAPLLAGWVDPDVFGRPGEGVHAPRVAGLAAVDLAGTAGAAYVAARYAGGGLAYFCAAFALLWALGAALHWAAGVDSAGNRKLAAAWRAAWPGRDASPDAPSDASPDAPPDAPSDAPAGARARRVTWADLPGDPLGDSAAKSAPPPGAPAAYAITPVPRSYAA